MRRFEHNRKSQQWFDPVVGSTIEWKIDAVMTLIYIVQDGGNDKNAYMDEVLSLLGDWDVEGCMYAPSTIYTR